jgi:hypothetical protein
MLDFYYCFMAIKGEKLGGGPADRLADVLRIALGAVGSVQLYWVSVKGCHIRGLPAKSVCVAYVD